MRKMKKFAALTLSAAMVMGMSMTGFAAEPAPTTTDAPIYGVNLTNVVVPANFTVAFNPDGLSVKQTSSDTAVTSQIVTNNYGMVNKGNKNKFVKLTFKVQDQNGKIVFGDADSVTNAQAAKKDTYNMNLNLVPASARDSVQIGATAIDKDNATAENMSKVAMTAASTKLQLAEGENYAGFWLEGATYNGTIQMDAANPLSTLTIKQLADNSGSIAGFTFDGTMNMAADWTKLTQKVVITVIYDIRDRATAPTMVASTGGYVAITNPFTSSQATKIAYTPGSGADQITVKKVEIRSTDGVYYDVYNKLGSVWAAATDTSGTITIDAGAITFYTRDYPTATTLPAIVTYEQGGATATAKIEFQLKAAS